VNHLVLSGTATHVLSGTRSSCYRGPESRETFWQSIAYRARNFSNPESFGFFLTDRAFSTAEDNQPSSAPGGIVAALFLNRKAGEAKRTPQSKGVETRLSFVEEGETA
jgi:hypothetical protein